MTYNSTLKTNLSMSRIIALLILTCSMAAAGLRAQGSFSGEEGVFDPSIKTIEFAPTDRAGGFPIIPVRSARTLTLKFDEWLNMDVQESRFTAELVHCDANWRPDQVLAIEFLEGFSNQPIMTFVRSEFTLIPYVHYEYTFPQEGEFFKVSGNYLLRVYRDYNSSDVVLTRRFLVVDNKVRIDAKFLLDARLNRQRLSQLAFDVYTDGLQTFDPTNDIKVVMLQNFRWDNAYYAGRPLFFRDNVSEFRFDVDRIFTSGTEFRWLDLRSTRLYGPMVQDIEETPDGYQVYLFEDKPRRGDEFGGNRDLNGGFWIEVQEWPYVDYQSDYLFVNFFLKAPQPYSGEVYVLGEFSAWKPLPEARMDYNAQLGRYEGTLAMKQGVYDYTYGVLLKGKAVVDETPIQGIARNGENYYSLLVYYRKPGDLTDQLLGYLPINYQD